MPNAIDRLLARKAEKPPRTYVLQNAHCGHVALAARHRRQLETVRMDAHVRGMHAWRVRLEPASVDRGSCGTCEADMKTLAPSKAGRRQKALRAAKQRRADRKAARS